jgi:intracellular septation protein
VERGDREGRHPETRLSARAFSRQVKAGAIAGGEHLAYDAAIDLGRNRKDAICMGSALRHLAEDFVSTIVFLVLFVASGNLALAVGCAFAAGIGQLALMRWRGKPMDLMQASSLALVVAFGAAALITADSRFMMAKPSVIHFAVGAVMLRPGWMSRYMPPIVRQNVPPNVLLVSGYAWATLMFALGLTNLYVAATFSVAAWAWFISVGAVGAKVVAFLVQFLVLRGFIRRRLRPIAP